MGPAGQREHNPRITRYHAENMQLANDDRRDSRRNYKDEPDNRYETVRQRDDGGFQKSNNGRNTICYDSDPEDMYRQWDCWDGHPGTSNNEWWDDNDRSYKWVKAVKQTMMTPDKTSQRS